MKRWRDAYHEAGFKWDQITLRELLWMSDLAVYVLPPEDNVRYRKYLDVWTEREAVPKILHLAEYYDSLAGSPGAARRTDRGLGYAATLLRKRLLGR